MTDTRSTYHARQNSVQTEQRTFELGPDILHIALDPLLLPAWNRRAVRNVWQMRKNSSPVAIHLVDHHETSHLQCKRCLGDPGRHSAVFRSRVCQQNEDPNSQKPNSCQKLLSNGESYLTRNQSQFAVSTSILG